jgi:hypothetical protein
MSIKVLQHTRSTGKMLTYDVEITVNSYEIFLQKKSLKHSGVFTGMFGEITGSDALYIHAVSDIENLNGMTEE